MKKTLTAILLVSLVFALAQPVLAAENPPIAPCYEDVGDFRILLTISSSGKATVRVSSQGNSTVKSIDLKVLLQRKAGSAWITLDGCTWEEDGLGRSFSKTYSASLTETGEYRAKAYFYVTTTAQKTLTFTSYATY